MAVISNLPYPSVQRVMEVTEFKSEGLALGAIKTLKWLDDGAPHDREESRLPLKFDMSKYIGNLYEDNEYGKPCGTVCCIAGAIQIFRPDKPALGTEVAMKLSRDFGFQRFGSSPLKKLFYPMDFDYYDIQPSEAAETLRRYLFTGEVVWRDEKDDQ